MSGICGFIRLDGGDADLRSLLAMLGALEVRGPDRTELWSSGGAALGHTLLATTREALLEHLPLQDPGSGCVITADVRLDNRADLIRKLSLRRLGPPPGDGELLLHAYLEWGEDCVHHLLGDYAFAIWDERTQTIFAARDPMGMRQFNYHFRSDNLFAFATEAEAILKHADIEAVTNDVRIADYIDRLEAADLTSTFFEGVHRLPPAHSLTLDGSGLRLRQYWRPGPVAELCLGSEAAYAEAFLEVFTEAVRCRLRSHRPVAAMLSGGLDSGSVTAIASRLLHVAGKPPLKTISMAGPDAADCPETRAIHASSSIAGLDPLILSYTNMGSYRDELLRATHQSREPFDGHMVLVRAVYLAAAKAGTNVVLDGVGGDVVLLPDNVIARYLKRFQFTQAYREVVGEGNIWGLETPDLRAMATAAVRAFLPRPIRLLWRRISREMQARRGIRDRWLSHELSERVDLVQRRKESADHCDLPVFASDTARQQIVTHPYLIAGRERYDRVASALGIEPRDPFMDLRVINFCLSLPTCLLQKDGWPKFLLRRAMSGYLPAVVRWKKGRHHVGWKVTEGLLTEEIAGERWERPMSDLVRKYVDVASLRQKAKLASHTGDDKQDLLNAAYLLNWIRDIEIKNLDKSGVDHEDN